MAQSYLKNPSIERLPTILEELHTGLLQIPPFQRDFVWTMQQQLALLSSVERGLPVGSLMVWRTKRLLRCSAFVGPYRVQTARSTGAAQYVLDGQQRLTTLYAALAPAFWTRHGVAPEASHDPLPGANWSVLYDLETQDFVFEGYRAQYSFDWEFGGAHSLLPLGVLFDDSLYDEWREREKLSREHANRARALRSAFMDYLIPVVPLVTDDIETVTLTFKRINSGGTPMKESDMLRALAWTETFDLSDHMARAREPLQPLGWGEAEDDTLMKVIAMVANQDATRVDVERLAAAIVCDPSVVQRAGVLLASAAEVFRKVLGIKTPKALPYQQVLIFTARALHTSGPVALHRERNFAGWVATVYIDERFGGASENMVRAEWRAFARLLDVGWEGMPRRRDARPAQAKECWSFNLASARSKGTALVLAAKQPHLANGTPVSAPESLVYTGSEDVGTLVLRSSLEFSQADGLEVALRSPANRVVCPAPELPALRERLFAADCPREIYESHLLDAEAHALLVSRDLENFFERRRELIRLAEEQWVRDHGGEVQVVREERKYSQG